MKEGKCEKVRRRLTEADGKTSYKTKKTRLWGLEVQSGLGFSDNQTLTHGTLLW